MGRSPCCDKNGLKKGPWTPEEDMKLTQYIQMHGPGNWRTLPKIAGLQRCGKSCRLRWTNYLRPDIKRGRFTFEEEETIIQLHSFLGNKWSAIAARLPGRTDNEIKNYWNTHIRKRLLRTGIDPVTHAPRLNLLDLSSLLTSPHLNLSNLLGLQRILDPQALRLAMSLVTLNNDDNNNNQLLNSQLQSQAEADPLIHPNQFENVINQQIPSNNNGQIFQNYLIPTTTANYHQSLTNDVQSFCYGVSDQMRVDMSENSSFQSLNSSSCNNNSHSFGFDSVLSSPLSSPLLNSPLDLVNGSTEDERESFCSNLFRFEIPEGLDFDDLM